MLLGLPSSGKAAAIYSNFSSCSQSPSPVFKGARQEQSPFLIFREKSMEMLKSRHLVGSIYESFSFPKSLFCFVCFCFKIPTFTSNQSCV